MGFPTWLLRMQTDIWSVNGGEDVEQIDGQTDGQIQLCRIMTGFGVQWSSHDVPEPPTYAGMHRISYTHTLATLNNPLMPANLAVKYSIIRLPLGQEIRHRGHSTSNVSIFWKFVFGCGPSLICPFWPRVSSWPFKNWVVMISRPSST